MRTTPPPISKTANTIQTIPQAVSLSSKQLNETIPAITPPIINAYGINYVKKHHYSKKCKDK
jgi:hypothetical protein